MNRRTKNWLYDLLMMVIIAAILAFAAYIFTACSPKYIPVPEYHYEHHHTSDTIIEKDSILSEQKTVIREADSTMLAELGIRLKEGERAILILRKELERVMNQKKNVVHDTVVQRDSIRVPYPIEKQLSRWESLKLEAGGYLFVLLAIVAVWLIVVWLRKRGIIFRRPRDGL